MGRAVKLILAFALMGLVFPGLVPAQTGDFVFTTKLLAGQTIDVGEVRVWNDGGTLYIKYVTSGRWCLRETHLHVATSLDGIPQTKKGNPIPGQFTYNDQHECVTEYLYTIPLGSWPPGTQLFIAAHAEVLHLDKYGRVNQEETAWAYGPGFPGKNWATYFKYSVVCTGRIGDFVWYDFNRNGLQDPAEPGLSGVAVQVVDARGNIVTATTDGSGYYGVAGLCSGEYTVKVDEATLPSGLKRTACNPNPTPPNIPADSNCSPAIVNLPDDHTSNPTIDFGFMTPCTGTIGDLAWHDLNRNGIQDGGESGLSGVTMRLLDGVGNTLATSTTGQNGAYQFMGLCLGTYYVEAVTPTGYIATAPCSTDETISGDSNCSPAGVTLPTDAGSNQTIDFGFVTPCMGAIGDFVWRDGNQNGIQDAGEPGISGVSVKLLDGTGKTLAATTTDGNGYYQFGGLCAGSYSVEVTTPIGYGPSPSHAPGSTPSNDSNGSPASVLLPAGNSLDQTIDFGFFPFL